MNGQPCHLLTASRSPGNSASNSMEQAMTRRWSPDFLDLLTALNDADARFMLVGGHAVGFFGHPRATKDFDLWVEASSENARRFGAPLRDLTEADFAHRGNGFRMGSPPFRIELLTEISGLRFEDALAAPRDGRFGRRAMFRDRTLRPHREQAGRGAAAGPRRCRRPRTRDGRRRLIRVRVRVGRRCPA